MATIDFRSIRSKYIAAPFILPARYVNVSITDDYSFVWSALAAMYPTGTWADLVSHYEYHFDEIKIDSLVFPMMIENIPAFEKLNPNLSITVFKLVEKLKPMSELIDRVDR